MDLIETVFWRRIDAAGSDACGLMKQAGGWRLSGTANFLQDGAPGALAYRVDCDPGWQTICARVTGFYGRAAIDIAITRDGTDFWLLNDAPQENAPASLDVDLGFTPATNLIAIRRLNLAIGAEASAPAAWLQLPDLRLGELPQFYQRKSATEYAYRAPSVGYSDVLKVSDHGFVTDYPGLWTAEAVVSH